MSLIGALIAAENRQASAPKQEDEGHKLLITEGALHEAITAHLHNNPPIPTEISAWDVADQIVKSLSRYRFEP